MGEAGELRAGDLDMDDSRIGGQFLPDGKRDDPSVDLDGPPGEPQDLETGLGLEDGLILGPDRRIRVRFPREPLLE